MTVIFDIVLNDSIQTGEINEREIESVLDDIVWKFGLKNMQKNLLKLVAWI